MVIATMYKKHSMNRMHIGKNALFAVIFTSVYLIVYLIFLNSVYGLNTALAMFAFSPVIMVVLVIFVLKYGEYNGRELKKDEEWGYGDKFTEK